MVRMCDNRGRTIPREGSLVRICKNCGRPVPPHNDLLFLAFFRKGAVTVTLTAGESCHILPVIEGGKVICRGCPEARYLSDSTGDVLETDSAGVDIRQAYAQLLKRHPIPSSMAA